MKTAGQLVLALLLSTGVTVTAQEQDPVPPPQPLRSEPIGFFVFDARGVMANLKPSNVIAANVGRTESTDLPGRGFGLAIGAHVYPIRGRRFALGVGADILLRARGSDTIPPATADGPEGPTIVTRMNAFAPQVSLNFGKREGWSYVSAGIGPASIVTELADDPFPDAESRPSAFNYGGGARWFAKKHVAFTFDVRFYKIGAQAATTTRPAYPGLTVTVLSAGVSLR
jgi:hypothetical protein